MTDLGHVRYGKLNVLRLIKTTLYRGNTDSSPTDSEHAHIDIPIFTDYNMVAMAIQGFIAA